MAKFCQNCGSALTEGTKFCPSCGTPVAQSAQPTQQQPSQQPQQQPKPYTQKLQVKIPEEFAQRNAARAQRNAARTQQKAAPVKKQKGKGGFAKLIAAILVLCIVVTGFVKPGFFLKGLKEKNDRGDSSILSGQVISSESASYNSMQNVEAITAYAERLEDEGNYEAAAQVWALLPAAAEDAAVEDAKKAIEDTPEMQAYKAMKESRDIASAMQGGKGE